MIEINEGGTALMSPEEIKQERARREALDWLRSERRVEQQKQIWHLFSYAVPPSVLIIGACFVGIIFFVSFKIMGEAWLATAWH